MGGREPDQPSVRPHDAPGAQAWGLLQWVRVGPANQNAFGASIWPKLAPKEDDAAAWDGNGPCPTCHHAHPTAEERQKEEESYAQLEHLLAEDWHDVGEALQTVRARKGREVPE